MLVKINIKDQDNYLHLDYRTIQSFQGNLKDLSKKNYDKLKKSLTEFGYFVPIYVWENEGTYKTIDGHGRLRLFNNEHIQFYRETEEEQEPTYEIPVLQIQAENEEDAKKKLLVINSDYQTMTQTGFDEFVFDLSEEWLQETTHFDILPMNLDMTPMGLEEEDKNEGQIYRVYIDTTSAIEQEEMVLKLSEIGIYAKTLILDYKQKDGRSKK